MYSSIWLMSWALVEAATPLGRLLGDSGVWDMLSVAVVPVCLALICGKMQRASLQAGSQLASILPGMAAVWAAACLLLMLMSFDSIIPWGLYLYWAVWAYGGILVGGSAGRRSGWV